jgi:hypothetical protein
MRIILFVLSVFLLISVSWAQQGTASAPQGASPAAANSGMHIQPGTVIPAELDKSLDAKKIKAGDPVVAKVSQDLLSNGQVVIPAGSKITGHVTQAQTHKGDTASELGIAFDQIALKNGSEIPLHASIQAVAPPPRAAAFAGSGNEPMNEGAPASGSTMGGMGQRGGVTGAAGNTPGGAASPYPQDATGAPAAPAPSAGAGVLSTGSQGAVGMKDVALHAGTNPSQGSVLSSDRRNVHLDSGTQLMLRVTQ